SWRGQASRRSLRFDRSSGASGAVSAAGFLRRSARRASWPRLRAMIHRCMAVRIEQNMTQLHAADGGEAARVYGDNTPQPVRSLREWLDHLAARDRLVVLEPGIGLRFELAAIAKRLDGVRATLFPRPGGHSIPVVSGLVSDRAWMADAMGVETGEVLACFRDAALQDRKSTRLNSSHVAISYAVLCLIK